MKDTRFSINYSNNFSFSKPSNFNKATPLQTVQAYKDMGTISYQTGQNVDTWLELLKEYNTNSSNYPDGYAVVDGLRYSLQKQISKRHDGNRFSNKHITFLLEEVNQYLTECQPVW